MNKKFLITGILFSTLFFNGFLNGMPQLGGYIKPYTFIDIKDSRYDWLATKYQLEIQGDASAQYAYFLAIDFDYRMQQDANGNFTPADLKVFPVEAYIDLYATNFDLRIGQQFIFWGKADWVNPTDNINPWDYQHMSSDIEDYRIPVTALNLKYFLGDLTLQTVVIPVFEPHRLPLPADSVAYPEAKLENTQYALRLMGYFGVFDASISYYHGYDHFSTLRNATSFGPPQLYAKYLPMDVIGADWVTTFNQIGLKWEGAYTRTADDEGNDIFIRNSDFYQVLGLEYSPSDKFSMSLQFSQKILLDYDEEKEKQSIDIMGMSSNMWAEDKTTNGISGLIKMDLMKFVDLQTIFVYNLKKQDYFTLSFLNWQPADAVNLTFGGVFFGGPQKSDFGRMRDEDRIFLQMKLNF